MKAVVSLICAAGVCLALVVPALAADEYVHGYTRSNGTVVQPYMRTAPDSTINNNYSTRPNVNPYTGREGTVAPNPYESGYGAGSSYSNPYAPAPSNPYAPRPLSGSLYGQ